MREKGTGWDLCSREGAVKEERFPHAGKSSHQWGLGWQRESAGTEGKHQCVEGKRVTCTDSWHCHLCPPSWDAHPLVWAAAGCWSSSFRSDPGRGLGLPVGKQPEEVTVTTEGALGRSWVHQRGKAPLQGEHKKSGGTAIGASFHVCMLSGNRMPPLWVLGLGKSCCHHRGLQRWAGAAAETRGSSSRS